MRVGSALPVIVVLSLGCATASDDLAGGGGAGGAPTVTSAGGGGEASSSSSGTTAASSGSTSSATTGATTSSASTTTTTGGGPADGTLIFSEYVEGSGNNKALEITNLGQSPFSLGTCTVTHFQNGSSTGQTPLALANVTLPSGASHVVCHTSFAMLGLCDQSSASIQHSGNDAIVLECSGGVKDVFGRVGQDMVWGTAPTVSMDATLRRSCAVIAGDTIPSDAFDPALEWTGLPSDTFAGLGTHPCP